MLRVGYSQNQSSRSNLGIGGFDLAERAYASESRRNQLRMQEAGPVGANVYLNTRMQLRLNQSSSRLCRKKKFEPHSSRNTSPIWTASVSIVY